MRWSKSNVKNVKNARVRRRIETELNKDKNSPVTGDERYWKQITECMSVNYRKNPELYEIGKGQQGVLTVEPYKSEILPFWKFANEKSAQASALNIFNLFKGYLIANDFVGADMAKKYLHMGFTRSRRYANHPSGKKYENHKKIRPISKDNTTNEKARCAQIFKEYWDRARSDPNYIKLKLDFINTHKKADVQK